MSDSEAEESLGIWDDPDLNMRERNPEAHENIQKVKCDWKFMAILSVFINRGIIEKAKFHKNMVFEDKKLVTSRNTGDPTILKVSNVDVYSINLFRHTHNWFDADMTYLNQITETNNDDSEHQPLDERSQIILDKLSMGLMTINEQIINFISHRYEELYDSKVKKIIEYLSKQRDHYISLGKNQLTERPIQFISKEHLNFAINVNNILGNLGPKHFYDAINVISTALFILQSKNSPRHTVNITAVANDLLKKAPLEEGATCYQLNRAEVVSLLYYIQQNMDTICISTETDDIPTWSIREDIFQKLLVDSKKYTTAETEDESDQK